MFLHQIHMERPDHDHMTAANKDKIKGKKPDDCGHMIFIDFSLRMRAQNIKDRQQTKHGWQNNAVQPDAQGEIVRNERFWRHDAFE